MCEFVPWLAARVSWSRGLSVEILGHKLSAQTHTFTYRNAHVQIMKNFKRHASHYVVNRL